MVENEYWLCKCFVHYRITDLSIYLRKIFTYTPVHIQMYNCFILCSCSIWNSQLFLGEDWLIGILWYINKSLSLSLYIYYIYIYIYHHVMPPARISLTLSRHFSLSFIASGRSSELHPVSSHSCCMYFWAGRPAFDRSYVGVHRSILLMSSSLLLQQCPACLVRLTWIVFVMGDRWPYS